MKNFIENALFLVPIVAIFVLGIALHYINKSNQPSPSEISSSSATYNYVNKANTGAHSEGHYQNYAMLEPFAENHPFDFTNVMQHMNPGTWMQMMNNMMNTMQMTQMMHQMFSMPMQMMNPTMWMDPHAMLSNSATGTVQQPMSPEEYKKWYEQQQSQLETNK